MKVFRIGFVLASSVLAASSAMAQYYWGDNFDVDSSANWNVNKANNAANNIATFAFDYSAYNIPSAPGSGGTTKGLRLEANIAGSVFGGLSVSPIGVSTPTSFTLTADVWMNYIVSGSGSTQFGALGWGTNGTTAQWGGGTQNSVYFGTTNDGQSSADFRAYSTAAPTSYTSGNAVYAAPGGAINNTNAYYTAAFPSVAMPATQNGAVQGGNTAAGATGFKWRKWTVQKAGNIITYKIDSTLIATVNATTITTAGSNILVSYFDTNSGSGTDPNRLNFMLVDNIQVVPEPASMVVMGFGALSLIRKRKK